MKHMKLLIPAVMLLASASGFANGYFPAKHTYVHAGELTAENATQKNYVLELSDNPSGSPLIEGYSLIAADDHPVFGKPKPRYLELGQVSGLHCLDPQCQQVNATMADGSDIPVVKFNIEFKSRADEPISAKTVVGNVGLVLAAVDVEGDTRRADLPVNDDLIAVMRKYSMFHEVHFLTPEQTSQASAASTAFFDKIHRSIATQQAQVDAESAARARQVAAEIAAEVRQSLGRVSRQPIHHSLSCNSADQLIGSSDTIDRVSYLCSEFPPTVSVSLANLQRAGYEVSQSSQVPVAIVDRNGFERGYGYRVNLLLTKVR